MKLSFIVNKHSIVPMTGQCQMVHKIGIDRSLCCIRLISGQG